MSILNFKEKSALSIGLYFSKSSSQAIINILNCLRIFTKCYSHILPLPQKCYVQINTG